MVTLTPEFKLEVETKAVIPCNYISFSQSSYETVVYKTKVDTLNSVLTGKLTYDMLKYHLAYEAK
jgi:hypothetical protein